MAARAWALDEARIESAPFLLGVCAMSLVLLAPMEGLIDEIMRDILTRAVSYDWCVTEFARVTGTVLPNRAFLRIAPELKTAARTATGTPVRVQLLGSDPVSMAENADRLAGLHPAGVDLNFGCPAPIVNRHRGGAALLDEPDLLNSIATACVKAVAGRVPVTAKMRLGIKDKGRCVETAQALADGGIDALVVHARTRDEFYQPPAHWGWLAGISASIKVPVVANGEIWSCADYWQCRQDSACNDVMLGRGAVADPFLVERIRAEMAGLVARKPEDDWPRLRILLTDFWQAVQAKVEPRHAPGRLKQWLNLLRRNYREAERLHGLIRPMRGADEVSQLFRTEGLCDAR